MTDYTQKCLELAKGCKFVERPTEEDWTVVETEIGLKLPRDFTKLVSAFGSGCFGVDLYLLNPCCEGTLKLTRNNVQNLWSGYAAFRERFRCALFPEPEGFFPLASTTSQIEFCVAPSKGFYHSSVHILNFGLATIEDTGMGLPEVIYKLYQSELPWAEELRTMIWGDEEPAAFFEPINGSNLHSENAH